MGQFLWGESVTSTAETNQISHGEAMNRLFCGRLPRKRSAAANNRFAAGAKGGSCGLNVDLFPGHAGG
jgi:hypothetical protein